MSNRPPLSEDARRMLAQAGLCARCQHVQLVESFKFKGRLAQLVEHLVYTERVGSSSLSSPTIIYF